MLQKLLKSLLILSLVLGIITTPINADSLWSKNNHSIYTTIKTPRVGDIVTIKIKNQSSAIHEAGTDTSKTTGLTADFYDFWDQYSLNNDGGDEGLRKRQNYRIGAGNQYRGAGRTSRKSTVKAEMSATVIQILDNGNLIISGEHSIKVNDETETIRVVGTLRPQDIESDNTVQSHKIANAKISVKGEGVVGSKQTPGLLSKMFGWLF